jgi:hypothetical protein
MPKFFEGFADRLKVPEGERDVQVFDDDLPGFFVSIRPEPQVSSG